MQRLILLRHGKTESVSASGADIDRALTDRGRGDAALIGQALAAARLAPDEVLVSNALRTRQTWDQISAIFPSAQVAIDPLLYLANADRLSHLVDAHGQPGACLMLIGHNPGLHELATRLAAGGQGPDRDRLMAGFPTSAAAVFVKAADSAWSLEYLRSPRQLRGDID